MTDKKQQPSEERVVLLKKDFLKMMVWAYRKGWSQAEEWLVKFKPDDYDLETMMSKGLDGLVKTKQLDKDERA